MIVRREQPADVSRVRDVHIAAFGGESGAEPVEARLLDELRTCEGWLPQCSLVVLGAGAVIGHVVCTRGMVGAVAGLGLGPIGVDPGRQRAGAGSALMHAAIGAADANDVPFIALLGSPAYYSRFGFVASTEVGIRPPDPAWGEHFQVRPLTAFDGSTSGVFRYAEPFNRL